MLPREAGSVTQDDRGCEIRRTPVADNTGDAMLRRALRRFVTGVTVVTTLDESRRLVGLTANSFTSVSLDPPLVLVCLDVGSRSYQHCLRRGGYVVNVLAGDQCEVARRFAVRGGPRGEVCPWHLSERGYPVLTSSLARFECALVDDILAGDHVILLGRVEAVSMEEGSSPLVFHGGQLFDLDAGPLSR